ncbi:MAG: hypothetical protein ABI854_05290 [Betaproteobacteria bacterium]
MQAVTIDWDRIELLPKWCCSVCAQIAVPWGRTLDNDYLCSKACYEARLETAATIAAAAASSPPSPSSEPRAATAIFRFRTGIAGTLAFSTHLRRSIRGTLPHPSGYRKAARRFNSATLEGVSAQSAAQGR